MPSIKGNFYFQIISRPRSWKSSRTGKKTKQNRLIDSILNEYSASLIACAALSLKQDAMILFKTLFQTLSSRSNNVRASVLTIFKQYAEIGKDNAHVVIVSLAVKQCVELLNRIDFEDIGLLEIILSFFNQVAASSHKNVFQSVFQDLVDHLLGWFLNPEVSGQLRSKISGFFLYPYSLFRSLFLEQNKNQAKTKQ